MQQFLVSTQVLADAFGVSDRRILQLVEAGVIEAAPGSGRARRFDLAQVVPQYAHFLLALAAGGPVRAAGPRQITRKEVLTMTLDRLKKHARRHGCMVRKLRGGGFLLVDAATNALAAPGELTLEQLAAWLDNLDKPTPAP